VEDSPTGHICGGTLLSVRVRDADITSVRVDALITAINSAGLWFGGIDGAIRRVAGNMFHGQLASYQPLEENQTVYAPAATTHEGLFGGVIFVVDDLLQPLHKVILAGLRCAEQERLNAVSIPALRTGVMAGAYEKTAEAALDQMMEAIRIFSDLEPACVRRIDVVTFNDPQSELYLSKRLQEIEL